MLRVASNALIVPPFECAWLSLHDYDLDGAFCLQFDCKGENDVTIILKPVPGAKRWQHYQRQPGPAGAEQLAVEDNYTVILGSHRNSKLKVEKNGDECATACGLPGCTVDPGTFTSAWINYQAGAISVGTGPAAAGRLTFHWADSGPAIPGIQHIGLSCWDRHVSYRNVVLLPPLPAQQLAEQHQKLLQQQQQQQQQSGPGSDQQQQQDEALQPVPSLLQLVMESVAAALSPAAVCHVLQLSELLLPRTQSLYDAAVQLAGRCFEVLVSQQLPELAGLSVDVLGDILQEPLLGVPELVVFQAVAAWCQFGCEAEAEDQQQPAAEAAAGDEQRQPQHPAPWQAGGGGDGCSASGPQPGFEVARPEAQVVEMLQLVRFAFMSEAERQAVLTHPFSRRCPLVQQLLRADLQRLQDSNGSSSPRGQYTFEQRRLVRPAAAAAGAAGAGAPAVGSQHCCMQHEGKAGHSSSECEACSAAAALPGSEASWHGGSKDSSSGAAVATTALSSGPIIGSSSSRVLGWGRWRRRLAPSCRELMFVCDGDRHGVLHFIATDYGTKQWVNPVLSKAVAIKASSPPSRYTDPKAIVSGQFLNTSFAGPRFIRAPAQPAAAAAAAAATSGPADPASGSSSSSSSGQAMPSTWWQLDLGPAHRLLVNYYTIRHDGSQDGFVRSWVLQGSNDLQHWIDLRRHRQDSTIRLAGQYGSWPVTGPAASMPFRAFRLLLLGPTTSASSPWAFCLSYWELYGHFYKLEGAGDKRVDGGSTEHPPEAGPPPDAGAAAAAGVSGATHLAR